MMNRQEISLVKRVLPPAHFTIKVDSYLKLFNELEDRYQSGVFEAGGYNWRLIFYPNGNKKRGASGHISLYLAIDDSNSHSDMNWRISVNFKFFVHDQNENKYLAIQEKDGIVREFNQYKKEWGFDRFLSIETFMEPLNGYLVNDSCAFGVEVFVIKRSKVSETFSMVSYKPRQNTHTWKIPNFRDSAYVGNYCEDDNFPFGERNWKLKICPMGDGSEKGRSLALYLVQVQDQENSPQQNRKMYAKFKLRVKNHNPNKTTEKQLAHWYSTDQYQKGCIELLPLVDLYDPKSGYLFSKTLTVEVEFLVVSQISQVDN